MERARTNRRTRHQRWRALALVAVVLAAACSTGNDDDGPQRRSTTTPSTAETTTTLSPEQEVESAYLAFWEMLERLSAAPNPDDPELHERTRGVALGEITDGLTTQRAQGHTAVTGPDYRHTILSVQVLDGTATLRDCQVDDSTILDQTGTPVAGGSPVTVLLDVALSHESGVWKVQQIDTVSSTAGVTACDS